VGDYGATSTSANDGHAAVSVGPPGASVAMMRTVEAFDRHQRSGSSFDLMTQSGSPQRSGVDLTNVTPLHTPSGRPVSTRQG